MKWVPTVSVQNIGHVSFLTIISVVLRCTVRTSEHFTVYTLDKCGLCKLEAERCGFYDSAAYSIKMWATEFHHHHHHFICSNNVKANALETVQWYSLWARHTRLIRALTVALSLHLIYKDDKATVSARMSLVCLAHRLYQTYFNFYSRQFGGSRYEPKF